MKGFERALRWLNLISMLAVAGTNWAQASDANSVNSGTAANAAVMQRYSNSNAFALTPAGTSTHFPVGTTFQIASINPNSLWYGDTRFMGATATAVTCSGSTM